MRLTKNVLTSIGAVALAAMLVNAIAPQAVHAAVAALVQISNTATNPALTSTIDDPGRIPYQAINNACSPSPCNHVTFGPVPANHRLVVEHISGNIEFTGTPSEADLTVSKGAPVSEFFTPTNPILKNSVFDQPVHFYVDQSESFNVNARGDLVVNFVSITATGYLLDCNAAPCAAVASF